ncbi:3-isopropylmalate dehydratase small subunit [Noviherbaspirillum saxi]|uniref:3-isopropylmalate dehydratase small subunit n=1 Tax=Noviherbaspirillum saxi TaxID=2320863 RepID=A0A3A3FLN7_9BURK|nr:3-isopropylmalate dehydratase small subunit [Noviherbaspirillum saxi]RJF92275.1 3-isopropylmalate dehydratase small subunit [Noviherbaspirillum saxi]
MTPFTSIHGLIASLDRNNVDTDAIIPKQFMKTIGRTGLGPFAFDAWRYLDEGSWGQDCSKRPLNPDFELNQPRFAGASILLTRKNFGCGSSREHAPWALKDMGFRAIVGESFGDIFRNNCLKNGILVVILPAAQVQGLVVRVAAQPGATMAIDLATRSLHFDGSEVIRFDIDTTWQERLLNGWDDISMTLQEAEAIRHFEEKHRTAQPWLYD